MNIRSQFLTQLLATITGLLNGLLDGVITIIVNPLLVSIANALGLGLTQG